MLLTVNELEVRYGHQTVLRIDQPIGFEAGDRVGIIGSNGAGKTTLIKSILGITDYKGNIATKLQPEQIGVHMQFNEYVSTMKVKHIMETILGTKISKNRKLQELIAYFEFEACLSKKFQALSGGQKQRFTIILVMFQNAPFTIYDEVTSGLDFETRQRLMEKLVDWYDGKDNTLLVVSHYYEELERLADKILLLDHGRVVAYGGKKELFDRYCGGAVYILDRNETNEKLTAGFTLLKSPEHLLAVSCRQESEEKRAVSLFLENKVNFRRSDCDIELMSINAKARFYEKEGMRNEG